MAELLAQLTKHTVIHGLDFTKVLEDILPDMSKLGRHSSIIHFVDGRVIQYVWAHKTVQPWGRRILIQCIQCGILQEWASVHIEDDSYSYECAYGQCGYKGEERAMEAHSFSVARPDCEILHSKRQMPTAWLKLCL
jgi:hypothetical protein